jgi:hypothetical protein
MKRDARDAAEERLQGSDAETEAENWTKDMAPDAINQLNFKIPLKPPFYIRIGLHTDFYKTKKLQVTQAVGVGVDYKF